MTSKPTLSQWERLKRLSFVIDYQVNLGKFTSPGLSHADANGMRYVTPGKSTAELTELHELVYDMGLVSPQHDWTAHEFPERPTMRELDLDATILFITGIFRADRFIDGLLISKVNAGLVQQLCRHAYGLTVFREGWPMQFPLLDSGRIRTGIVAKSLDGKIEGRTTGGRRRCPSNQCNGWLVGVHWETGQQLHICTEGWHYDPQADELRVIGGGPISARFVSPKPLGVLPLPRREWPTRAQLLKSKAWSISTR
jgi:hypothetical protein